MLHGESHLSDQDLLLAADGEVSPARAARMREHLAACEPCRARLNELEDATLRLVRLHRHDLDPRLPPAAGPRALLRARLADAASRSRQGSVGARFGFLLPRAPRRFVFAAVLGSLLLVLAIGARTVLNRVEWSAEAAAAPKPQLTPGAVVPLTKEDVCGGGAFAREPLVPASLQRQVFEEYGIERPQPDAYEIDYLITPELGGATSIRNLWPQPYYHTAWHARVKDQLEDRLHAMVCSGEIDLATAQHDIASNWIAAYKKYFHTDRPLVERPKTHGKKSAMERRVLSRSSPQATMAGVLLASGTTPAPSYSTR